MRALAEAHADRTLVVTAKFLSELTALPAGVGVLAVVPTLRPATTAPGEFCLLLDDVQDPGNVGSMLRSAAAAGVAQVFLSKHCAFAWSPKVLRAGQGAHFCLDIHEDVDLPAWAAAYRAARRRGRRDRRRRAARVSTTRDSSAGSRSPSATKARDSIRRSSRRRRSG